jgi:hypothetical protein
MLLLLDVGRAKIRKAWRLRARMCVSRQRHPLAAADLRSSEAAIFRNVTIYGDLAGAIFQTPLLG